MIMRAKRSLPFTQIANKTIYDKSISLKARMLLILMLTKPNDWCFSFNWFIKESGMSEDTVRKLIKELIEHKYVYQEKVTSKTTGRFIGWAYTVYECNDENDWSDTI